VGIFACNSCETLKEQLKESRLREQRLMRQIEVKDAQVEMVLRSKFDNPVVQNAKAPEREYGLPIETLTDVTNFDDESFVEALRQ
jgi:hypothetical protein